MGYLYFVLVVAVILAVICWFVFSEPAKEISRPRTQRKPTGLKAGEGAAGNAPKKQQMSLEGGRYIPSYKSNPDAVKHIERFLSGFAARKDQTEERRENADDERLPSGKKRNVPAGRSESGAAQEPVQLSLRIEDPDDDVLTVND